MPSNTLLDKGEINVHLYREDDNACICVADNGQGIIDKDKKHIFERFYQVKSKLRKNRSGIGLHIAKRICTSTQRNNLRYRQFS